jgi:hypothetical protein
MASRKEEEPQEFKVVDKRLFTSEGERRADAPPETPSEPATETRRPASPVAPAGAAPRATSASASAAAPVATTPPPPAPGAAQPPSTQFDQLIMSLVTTAMYQLGMAARPGEQPPPADLQGAQETIDLLGLLQQKTKGNLTREEEELLIGSLQELRLAFVEISRRSGRIR